MSLAHSDVNKRNLKATEMRKEGKNYVPGDGWQRFLE